MSAPKESLFSPPILLSAPPPMQAAPASAGPELLTPVLPSTASASSSSFSRGVDAVVASQSATLAAAIMASPLPAAALPPSGGMVGCIVQEHQPRKRKRQAGAVAGDVGLVLLAVVAASAAVRRSRECRLVRSSIGMASTGLWSGSVSFWQ